MRNKLRVLKNVSTVIVLGGDGFCGWATSLHLSNIGYDIVLVDNLSRRRIDLELEVESLTPIAPISVRLQAWEQLTRKRIRFERLTLGQDYYQLKELIAEVRPTAIVHFAEQRAAPYSMKSAREKRYTVNNNLNATNDVLCAIVETGLDVHLVHLGTMGVYGYGSPGMDIPEGYLRVTVQTAAGAKSMEILYPADPGSIYHMTKTQDQLFFYYFNKNDGVRITDLHQGIVWGTQTPETMRDERLINRFDYDGDYGTVLNRFVMQAALGYPLTIHGTGGQTRAFIHIRDTVRCIELAIANPPKCRDRVQIFNQMTETHRLIDLAKLISEMSGTPLQFVVNPRNEAAENNLRVTSERFAELGFTPTKLEGSLLTELRDIAKKYMHRCDQTKIPCTSVWRPTIARNSVRGREHREQFGRHGVPYLSNTANRPAVANYPAE
jgi:UDP-sulfoquinovose synthase